MLPGPGFTSLLRPPGALPGNDGRYSCRYPSGHGSVDDAGYDESNDTRDLARNDTGNGSRYDAGDVNGNDSRHHTGDEQNNDTGNQTSNDTSNAAGDLGSHPENDLQDHGCGRGYDAKPHLGGEDSIPAGDTIRDSAPASQGHGPNAEDGIGSCPRPVISPLLCPR